MVVWKLIARHERRGEMIEWIEAQSRIAIGWGRIGDLDRLSPTSSEDIKGRVRAAYPASPGQNHDHGGKSLWNLWKVVAEGDLVLLVGEGSRRLHVVEVVGPYEFNGASDVPGDYFHQREVVIRDDDPNEIWEDCGGRIASAQGNRLTLARCGEIPRSKERYFEGGRVKIVATVAERKDKARRACIEAFGASCAICEFDFGAVYGEIGEGFIHVHHLDPLSEQEGEREVDPKKDLIPLCPNCHAMVHRTRPPLTPRELRKRMKI